MSDPHGADDALARLEAALLGGPRTLTLAELAERVGTDVDRVRLYWHALGLPSTDPDQVAFTEADVEVLRDVLAVATENELSDRTAVSLVRSVGHVGDRLAVWQVEALVEHLSGRHDYDDATARAAVIRRIADVHDLFERQLVHAWRRQMTALAGRLVAEIRAGEVAGHPNAPSGSGAARLPLARAVGFADIVAFTSRTATLGPHELASFVQDFEARARDVVTAAGGRVVKTIGDAVLFVADDVERGVEVAVGLAEAFGSDGPTPARVSLVWGRVLARFGDVFGPTVNLAARLAELTSPDGVLVDSATADLVRHDPRWTFSDVVRTEVAGLGHADVVRLSRA